MKKPIHSGAPAKGHAAFTQVELLVLVMVLAMLAMLGLSTTAIATNQTKIAECSNNLRQLALSQLLYASDNSDNLPAVLPSSAEWPFDLDWSIGDMLNQYGTSVKTMYCPGTAPRFTPAVNRQLYVYGAGTFHIIGYSMTLPFNSTLVASNINYTTTPPPPTSGSWLLPQPSASERVLSADANLSQNSGGEKNYSNIAGGFYLHHLCPHLDGMVPAGGNVAMLDGHVEWRPFKLMRARTPLGEYPTFYW